MIPFGSQRGGGQDLVTHVSNAQDNERVECYQIRGSVSRDPHAAVAEWEAQAFALTRCTNYLYSLSVNPDQRQGRLTRAQYLDYIERTERSLGLSGQPREVWFHIKKDRQGVPREHCHVFWSRVDAERGKAIHIPFDHQKLMMVTREFARDHGLRLPEGYYKDKTKEPRRSRQMAYYAKRQQDMGGLSPEERRVQVTDAWQKRDTPRSFVRSLEDMGYMLATGDRDYVLVDLHGHMNALPRLIDDPKVKVKHLREFLGKEFPKDSLPTVDEARALASAHRAAMELFSKNEERAHREAVEKQRREELERKQQPRRRSVEQETKALASRQLKARQEFSQAQERERTAFRQSHLQESQRIKIDRAAHRPQGLAAFIGRITGVELITRKVHQYRDATRYRLFLAQKAELAGRQQREAQALDRRQEIETLTVRRRLHALDLVEKRELRSLEMTLLKERRIEDRERTGRAAPPPEPVQEPMPPLADAVKKEPGKAIDLKTAFGQAGAEPAPGYLDQFNKAAEKEIDLTAAFRQACIEAAAEPAPDPADAFNRAAKEPIDLSAVFGAASGSGGGEGEASGDAAQNPAPEAENKIQRRRRRDRAPDVERPMRTRRRDSESGNEGTPGDDPTPRRRRSRDPDRGR